MATLGSHDIKQKYVTMGDQLVGIHLCTLRSTSDVLKVPQLANAGTSGESAKQLQKIQGNPKEAAVTVSNSDAYTVTITGGVAGDECVIVTLHPAGRLSNIPEE